MKVNYKSSRLAGCLSAVIVMSCTCSIGLRAQDYPKTVIDGLVLQADSLSMRPSSKPTFVPRFAVPLFPVYNPGSLMPPMFETKEQRAARINQQTFSTIMLSVDRTLYWHRLPEIPKPWKLVLGISRLFLSNPYAFPEGYVPLMNSSFPFIYAKTPGLAPYENPYTSDMFPKCIDTEFDFTTGTYKQVVTDWSELQKRMSGNRMVQSVKPVPSVPVTPVERMIR